MINAAGTRSSRTRVKYRYMYRYLTSQAEQSGWITIYNLTPIKVFNCIFKKCRSGAIYPIPPQPMFRDVGLVIRNGDSVTHAQDIQQIQVAIVLWETRMKAWRWNKYVKYIYIYLYSYEDVHAHTLITVKLQILEAVKNIFTIVVYNGLLPITLCIIAAGF